MRHVANSDGLVCYDPMLGKQVGTNIERARKAKGWTLERLAATVRPKTSHQHISRIEKGQRTLTVDWIERIAKALGVDPVELIDPGRARATGFILDEQVANEVARMLAKVALAGEEPGGGTVQALSLMLQELTTTFSAYPEAATDPQVARPVVDLASRRFSPAGN
jgi:transcriptional regulator with XRE-family HTH domain